jgi:hypothetical protein
MPVVPSRLHEHAPKVRVAGLGDGAATRLWSARVLGRHHARVAHHLAGLLEATEAAEFGRECDGRYFCHASQRLQRFDDRSQLLGRGFDGLINRGVEALDALNLVIDLEDQLEQRRILLGMWQLESVPPATTRLDIDDRAMSWSDGRFWNVEDSPERRMQFFAVGCAINFRFWAASPNGVTVLQGVKQGEHHVGAMYMSRCLRLALENPKTPILDADFLAQLDLVSFTGIFADDDGLRYVGSPRAWSAPRPRQGLPLSRRGPVEHGV